MTGSTNSSNATLRRAKRYAYWRGFRFGFLHPIQSMRGGPLAERDRQEVLVGVRERLEERDV